MNLDENLRSDIELFQRVRDNLKLVQQRLAALKANGANLSADDTWIAVQIAEQIEFLEARISDLTADQNAARDTPLP